MMVNVGEAAGEFGKTLESQRYTPGLIEASIATGADPRGSEAA
jgi:hypothetical protein